MSGGAFDVRRFDRIDSTNRYLADEARHGAPEGLVAVADFQTAGRGRLGRQWEAPPGACLLASVLLRPEIDPSALHLCTVLMAVSASEAAAGASGVRPDIKWPNDLVVHERKVAGILAEVVGTRGGGAPGPAVVVGIGVNVSWPGPPDVGGTSLEEAGTRSVDLELLLDQLLASVARRRPLLDAADGQAELVAELRGRCVTVGRDVQVTVGDEMLRGRAADIDGDGRLVLELAGEGGRVVVAAGDVVHLRPG